MKQPLSQTFEKSRFFALSLSFTHIFRFLANRREDKKCWISLKGSKNFLNLRRSQFLREYNFYSVSLLYFRWFISYCAYSYIVLLTKHNTAPLYCFVENTPHRITFLIFITHQKAVFCRLATRFFCISSELFRICCLKFHRTHVRISSDDRQTTIWELFHKPWRFMSQCVFI